MTTTELIAELEQLRQNLILTEKQQQALEEACKALANHDNFETVEMIAQFLASLAGVASYIQHLLS